MKKIILLFVMALTVIDVQAKKDRVYATFGTPDVNAVYGGTYTWSASTSNLMTMFEFSDGELANYSSLKFTIANLTGGQVRVGYYVGNKWTPLGTFGSDGEKSVDLTSISDRSSVTKICFGGNDGNNGSVNIGANGVYLVPTSGSTNLYASFQTPAISATYTETGTKYSWVGTSNTLMDIFTFGSGELANYSTLNFTFSELTNEKGVQIVFVYSDLSTSSTNYYTAGTKNKNISELLASGKTAADVTKIRFGGHSNNGSCTIQASDFYLETAEYEGMDITTTIKSSSDKDTPFAWSATGTLSSITNNLGKTDAAVIFGYANNNDDAHGSFDVTGYDNVTVNLSAFDSGKNTSVRLLKGDTDTDTGRSNVEFTTASGILSYTKKLTFTTCASIKAGQGASNCQNVSSIIFKKEFAASSTTKFEIAASSPSSVAYDRTFTVGQKSTVCLPFALTAEEVTAAGTFYELKSVTGTTLNFESVTTTEAYKPYMFKAKTATPFATLTDKTIVASKGAETSYTVGGYTFQGTLAHQTVANGVYGWNSANGEFLKTNTADVTIDAFRAYITGGASARLEAIFDDDELTAIQTVKAAEAVQDNVTYNLQGQRVGEGHKGLVIKNGKKYIVK